MKATDLINKLSELIKEYGDCNVYYYDDEKITYHDSVDVVIQKEYGMGNKTKIFYIE